MKPQYEGRSPGRLWYMWQHTKAFAQTLVSKATRPDAKSFGKNTAFSTGSLLAAGFIYSNITMLGLPTLVLCAGIVVGGFFGVKAFHDARGLNGSSVHLNYIRDRENKWLVKQSRPKLLARIKAFFTKTGTVLGYGLAAAGAALATAATLQYTGVISSAVLTTALGSIAAVSLPVVIGVAAAAIPLGIAAALLCRKATRRLLGIKPPEKKSFFYKAPQNDNKVVVNNKNITSSFTHSATVKKQETKLSEDRLKAAEARKANRKRPRF